eukprot:m.61122 g.61122  ORF g.61122 m.61122 type:complete len:204 (+) comp8003_c2_seq1:29-640(+)
MLSPTALVATALVATAMLTAPTHAHPSGLECGTDSTTRLQLGKTVMEGPVTDGSFNADGVEVSFRLGKEKEPSEVYVSVDKTVATAMFFAARIVGPGTLRIAKGNPFLAMTANCTKQLYTNVTSNHGVYVFYAEGATEASRIHVGYSDKGPKGIALIQQKPETATQQVPTCSCIKTPTCAAGSKPVKAGNCGNHGQYPYYCCQ